MVDNWLPNFDMDEQRKFEPQKRIEENLARIRSDIEARRRWIEPASDKDRAVHVQFLNRGVKFEPEDLGGLLAIDADACKGCIHACPHGAIHLATGEKNLHARWRNEHVTLARIMAANSGE